MPKAKHAMKRIVLLPCAVCVALAATLAVAHPGHAVDHGEITLAHLLAHVFTSPQLLMLLALLAALGALLQRSR